MSPGELQTVARAWNELLKASGLQNDWGAQDSLAASITVSETAITRRAREEGLKALGHFRWPLHKKNWPSVRCLRGESSMTTMRL